MKTRRLFGGRHSNRIVLFSSKGKAIKRNASDVEVEQKTGVVKNQNKIIDFAALSAWYTEQNAVKEILKDIRSDWNMPNTYAEKKRNLRFLSL